MADGPSHISDRIEVRQVTTRRDMKQFILLPWRIYQDDPLWVPPLILERRLHFSSFNPFFKHADWQAWLAYRNDEPVGRICTHIDYNHRKLYGQDTGHFGLLETENNAGVMRELIRTGENWLSRRHVKYVTGPFNFTINDECGVLVDGFDTPPVVMMPHSRVWYDSLLKDNGYGTAVDLFAYWVNISVERPGVMTSLIARYDNQVHIRTLDRRNFSGELEVLRDIFNDAWSRNWGFIPFGKEEFADLGNSLRFFLPDEFIQIAEVEGEPVAFIVLLPNLNEILKDLDGRLLPFGWLKLARALKKRMIRTGRVPLMGVRRKLQNSRLGVALAYMLIDRLRDAVQPWGLEEFELSWILEGNMAMRNILNSIGCREYKTYRIYEKTLHGS